MTRSLITVLCFAVLLFNWPAQPLNAQTFEVGVSAGPAFPTGHLGYRRDLGYHAALSLGVGTTTSGWGFRGDLGVSAFPGGEIRATNTEERYRDLRNISLLGSVVYGFSGNERFRPYVLLGGGMYRMSITGRPNPYGWVPSVHAGAGIRVPVGGWTLTVEIQPQLILSDYGNRNFQPSSYVPLLLGARL